MATNALCALNNFFLLNTFILLSMNTNLVVKFREIVALLLKNFSVKFR